MPTYDYECDGCGHTFEEWQSFEQRLGEHRAFPHGHDDLERAQSFHKRVVFDDVIAKRCDDRSTVESGPVGVVVPDALVVVEDRHVLHRRNDTAVPACET